MTDEALEFEIREGSYDDEDIVVQFNTALALESEGIQLNEDRLRAGVRTGLRGDAGCRYFIACHRGEVIGQLMYTREWSDWRNGFFWWIQSVYVKPNYRQKKVFSRLYRYLNEEARISGNVCGLRLYVAKGNEKAFATYIRMGMHEACYRLFETEFDG